MPRPTMDVSGPTYQKILKERYLYREYRPYHTQMKNALDALDHLEQKASHRILTYSDQVTFAKAKALISLIERDRKQERTTTHYIWHTRGDNKVRASHAANNGRRFAWNDPPPTGHPGEDYNCRCWAEPFEPKKGLQEYISQTITSAVRDVLPAWTHADFVFYYLFGGGKTVQLSDIGHLQKIIDNARTQDQAHLEGGGTIFERVESQVIEKARQNGEGSFPWHFDNSYNFKPAAYEFGKAGLQGKGVVQVVDRETFWMITADIDYHFYDTFTDTLNIDEAVKYLLDHFDDMRDFPGKDRLKEFLQNLRKKPGKKPGEPPYEETESGIWDLPIITRAYDIIGGWTTRIEAVVKK